MPEAIEPIPKEFRTCPVDPRFPNQNQTRYCYNSYLKFHRCKKVRGEDFEACQYFRKCYKSLCPNDWVSKWDEQVAEDRFPGNI
ncbi:cytochrome c oxidase subunit 6B1 isoform X2 [Copidosoma floridanum]|uniref:cytochrome c oxidase subunit 6B1 isoform X2 n=1 Tax=Copidosoma floridanum TaxID=29053 RepID=UPI0006C95382|nr:cytochrome c oxidase subunit 6B1 isoform X2 [Copidosoma floridanum]XP_014213044.1 cytochrome c oxidase subunit 6B1 isoform X2 [Copidosoma floridanum]